MNWTSLEDFITLRGYGLYVWGSYALALLIAMLEPQLARHRHQRALARIREEQES